MKIINYEKIEANINDILKTNRLFAVLKNDAYGFNIDKLIKILDNKNIDGYFINTIDEAISLRLKTNKDIYLMGGYLDSIDKLIKYNIIPTASSINEIDLYKNNNIKYSIKLNVGMNRFGFNLLDESLLLDDMLVLIYAHFPIYDDLTNEKINHIEGIAKKYNKKFCVGGSILYGNTNAPLRLGFQMYKDSLSLYGRIISFRKLSINDCVGYNKEYKAKRDEMIAVLDIGYYNGIRVGFNGYAYYKKNKYKCIGRICMNHMFIKASADMEIGEYVELISENISINEFIKYNNCTEYEAFLSIK